MFNFVPFRSQVASVYHLDINCKRLFFTRGGNILGSMGNFVLDLVYSERFQLMHVLLYK